MEQVTFVTVHDCSFTHRGVLSNRQQWVVYKRLNTSNSKTDSPIDATFNAESCARLDKFSGGCAECQIHITRHPLPECDVLVKCGFSCTSVSSNLDPFRLPQFQRIHIEVTHAESTDFDFWLIVGWLCRVEIVNIRCALVLVLSL